MSLSFFYALFCALKLEAEIISRRPEFGMENRKLLHLVDFERGVFVYEGKEDVYKRQ